MSTDNPSDPLRLINSDERILGVLVESNRFLGQQETIAERINCRLWAWRSLVKLLPQTIEKLWSGHTFPLVEAEYELECSVELAKLGYYKHAIGALRNLLELGLLSVYWDIEDQSHIDIKKWLGSREQTPFLKRGIFRKLIKNQNIYAFDNRHKIFEETSVLYEDLCNYTHTKGMHFSSRRLNQSNFNTFNAQSLRTWMEFYERVTKLVVSFHLLKYPVGLQETPLEQKFGINGPVGGFLEPHESERLRELFDPAIARTLQEISNNDEIAKGLAEWVNSQPDITEEQLAEQFERDDKQWIEMQGFDHWHKEQLQIYESFRERTPDAYAKKLEYFETLRVWAQERGFMQRKTSGA